MRVATQLQIPRLRAIKRTAIDFAPLGMTIIIKNCGTRAEGPLYLTLLCAVSVDLTLLRRMPPQIGQHLLAEKMVGAGLVSLARAFEPGHDIGVETQRNRLLHRAIEAAAHRILPGAGRQLGDAEVSISARGLLIPA